MVESLDWRIVGYPDLYQYPDINVSTYALVITVWEIHPKRCCGFPLSPSQMRESSDIRNFGRLGSSKIGILITVEIDEPREPNMSACNVCGNEVGNTTHIARELHLGMGDEFKYFECSSCGCLQIVEVPKNLSKYYPSYYYSYKSGSTLDFSRRGLGGYKQRFVLRALTNYYFGKKSFFGKWLASESSLSGDFPLWVRPTTTKFGVATSSPILDVGCGRGKTLLDMRAYGFTNLQGVDPFLDSDVFYENGVKIYKKESRT